jgi:hypothetical protein
MPSFYGTAPHSTPAPPTPTKFPQQLVPAQREVWPQRPFILVCVPNAIRTTKPARALEVVCAYTTTYYFTGLNQRVWHQLRQQMASAHTALLVLRPRHETSLDAIVRHHHTKRPPPNTTALPCKKIGIRTASKVIHPKYSKH